MRRLLLLSFLYPVHIMAAGLNLSLPSRENALMQPHEGEITVNHRILANVNGKMISVIDVMKKMDMLFYKQFPQYADSKRARLQYYQMHWKHVLQDLINRELVAADAAEHNLKVSSGDLRQEMELTLGPNIIENLDKAGLTLEEATKMVQEDVILRQMMGARVSSKAQKAITPQNVRRAYEEYAKQNQRQEEWVYSVLSIRNSDTTEGKKAAELLHEGLVSGTYTWDPTLVEQAKNIPELNPATTFTLSNEYRHTANDMSTSSKEALVLLSPKSYSSPIPQKSRTDQTTVYRIYYLNDKTSGGVPVLAEVENELKDKLYKQAVEKETQAYLKRLYAYYGYRPDDLKSMIPENFEPFQIQ